MSRIDIHDRAFGLDRYERQGAPDMGDSVLGTKERESARPLITADIGQPTNHGIDTRTAVDARPRPR